MYKILLVEDDVILAEVLKDYFEEESPLEVLYAADGEEAVSIYEKERPCVVLLDVKLPKKNGFEVIKELRKIDFYVPIVLMTGTEVAPTHEIRGYKLGAVNYLKKPVIPEAVLAQIESILHLSHGAENYSLGGYHITIQSQVVKINDNPIQLREKDIQVLSILLKKPGIVVTRQYLLQAVWQDDGYNKNNALDSAISRIRKAIQPFPTISLQRIYAEGYMICENR